MRIKRFTQTAFLLLGVGLILGSCGKPTRSQKTGIVYNSKTNGGYMRFRKTHPAPGPGLIPIEGGTFVMGGSADQDVAYEYNNTRRRVSVSSFYMDETEISNQDWLDYLHWITLNYPGNREMYYNALPDTLVWRSPLAYNEPYVDNYLRHPAYQDYPVVGVTWSQAQDYCVYRTNAANENILRETGKLASWKDVNTTGKGTDQPYDDGVYLNNQYNGKEGKKAMKDLSAGVRANGGAAKTNANGKATRPVRMEDGLLLPSFRLPSELEWEYAALGLVGNSQFENIEEGKIYPWNGMGVRSPKRTTRGMIMANFKRGAGDNMGVAGYLNDKADITAPVRSYQPNDFGLYNMAGNVNEWVADTYRQTSFEEMDDFNGFRGNEFTVKRLADPDKGIYAKDKNGRIIKDAAKANRKQTWAELMAERNGGTPANAAANTTAAQGETASPLASRAYKADARGYRDSADSKLYGITTLVNDHSKVYKGGSWNDRAMWLNPSTRRFMDQDDANAEVGFRCAMTMIGAAEIHPNGRPHFSVKKPKAFTPKSK